MSSETGDHPVKTGALCPLCHKIADHPAISGARCTVCNKERAHLCNVCASTAYCSEICRTADHSCHELVCKKYANLPPRPTITLEQHFHIAIFFPVGYSSPSPVWLRYDVDREQRLTRPRIGDFINNQTISRDIRYNARPLVGDPFRLERDLELFLLYDWENSDSNAAAMAVTGATNGDRLRGPMLLTARHFPPGLNFPTWNFHADVCAADLRYATDFLRTQSAEETPVITVEPSTFDWVGKPILRELEMTLYRKPCLIKLPSMSDDQEERPEIRAYWPESLEQVSETDDILRGLVKAYRPKLKPFSGGVPVRKKFLKDIEAINEYLTKREEDRSRPKVVITLLQDNGDFSVVKDEDLAPKPAAVQV